MKAPIAQAAAEAASAPGYPFIFFWGLEILKFIYKTRISAGSKFIHSY
jgi:hypothetical protein